MLVSDKGTIYIETAHPAHRHLKDFLISCCEPVSRTHHMEEYRLDSSSVAAASAEGTYTCEIIRHFLYYFRLDSARRLPIDLERYEALERWAATEEAAADPLSFQNLFAKEDDAAVATAANSTVTTSRTTLSPGTAAMKTEVKDNLSSSAVIKREEEDGCAPPPLKVPRRTISLQLSSSAKPEDTSASANAMTPSAKPALLTSVSPVSPPLLSSRPAVDWAVVDRSRLTGSDAGSGLPPFVSEVLRQEEESLKLQVVLQPGVRSFTRADPLPTSAGAGAGAVATETETLYYFLVSQDRGYLEGVVEAAKPFLEPVILYGTERYILSDIDVHAHLTAAAGTSSSGDSGGDGGGGGALSAEGGRPQRLRLLFTCRDGAGKRGGGGGASHAFAQHRNTVYKARVRPGTLRDVKDVLFRKLGIWADCFYDYLQDRTLHVPRLSLSKAVRLRPYQVASLARFLRGRKAHQGVVVLPCGAGKTLTGIGAAAALQKRTIVLCVNSMSVYQWREEFIRWTNLPREQVTVCTSEFKSMPGEVFITTYDMLTTRRATGPDSGEAAKLSEAIMNAVTGAPWGLLLLDEVHTAVAKNFQEALNKVQYKCVLGLSATLLREDQRIGDLRHLVGPKLYEANWLELTRAGFLAPVECATVHCPMYYHREYTEELMNANNNNNNNNNSGGGGGGRSNSAAERQAAAAAGGKRRRGAGNMYAGSAGRLASCNPYKVWCTQALLEFHRNRTPADKVIIFCDYLEEVRYYARQLHLPFMNRSTGDAERSNILRHFKESTTMNAVILTRVGDVALDLPCASVIIQISGLGKSRRQEAQRLGRILRPKPPSLDNTCAYFYTLVSRETHEVRINFERQSWLRDQGFAYRALEAENVLAEFSRIGGVRCCLGAPRWWRQTSSTAEAATTETATGAPDTAVASGGGGGGTIREFGGACWEAFPPAASAAMQRAFDRGQPTCLLTPRLHGSGSGEWLVRFSSADAPHTFGLVRMGETEEAPTRRIACGTMDPQHDCLATTASGGGGSSQAEAKAHGSLGHLTACTSFALSTLLHRPVGSMVSMTAAAAAAAASPRTPASPSFSSSSSIFSPTRAKREELLFYNDDDDNMEESDLDSDEALWDVDD